MCVKNGLYSPSSSICFLSIYLFFIQPLLLFSLEFLVISRYSLVILSFHLLQPLCSTVTLTFLFLVSEVFIPFWLSSHLTGASSSVPFSDIFHLSYLYMQLILKFLIGSTFYLVPYSSLEWLPTPVASATTYIFPGENCIIISSSYFPIELLIQFFRLNIFLKKWTFLLNPFSFCTFSSSLRYSYSPG